MTAPNDKNVKAILETVAATQDPKVIAEAKRALAEIIKDEAKNTRRGVEVPTESHYSFKQGEQVAILSANGKIRTNYEYLERAGKFDKVMDVKSGLTHRLWLNKLIPMSVASRMVKEQEKRREQAEKDAAKVKKQA